MAGEFVRPESRYSAGRARRGKTPPVAATRPR